MNSGRLTGPVALAAAALFVAACGSDSSGGTVSQPSTPPSQGSSGGGTSASANVACKLLTSTEVNSFAPPDGNLKAVSTGGGPQQNSGATDQICGWAFWSGGGVNQGTEEGYLLIDLSCGPGAAQAVLSDEVASPTFTIGPTTADIGLTRGIGSQGVGDPQSVLSNAVNAAKALNACG